MSICSLRLYTPFFLVKAGLVAGFRVQGLGLWLRVQSSGFRVYGRGLWAFRGYVSKELEWKLAYMILYNSLYLDSYRLWLQYVTVIGECTYSSQYVSVCSSVRKGVLVFGIPTRSPGALPQRHDLSAWTA